MNSSAKGILGIVAIAGAALFTSSTGTAQDADANAEPTVEVTMNASDIVQSRRVSFFLSTQAVSQVKAGIDDGGDLRRTVAGARMLAAWAEAIPSMFPAASNVAPTRATSAVWDDPDGFAERAEEYRAAAMALANAAQQGDREAANTAFFEMAAACQTCHQGYREQ